MSGELENTGKRGPGRKVKEWTDCVAKARRLFVITGDRSTAALDPGVWCSTIREGGCRFMAAWAKRRPNTGRGSEKRKKWTRLRLHLE